VRHHRHALRFDGQLDIAVFRVVNPSGAFPAFISGSFPFMADLLDIFRIALAAFAAGAASACRQQHHRCDQEQNRPFTAFHFHRTWFPLLTAYLYL